MNIREAGQLLNVFRHNGGTRIQEDLDNRVNWSSERARGLIDGFRLMQELGIDRANVTDRFLVQGYLSEKILQLHAYALELIGKKTEAVGVVLKSRAIGFEIAQRVRADYPQQEGIDHARNIKMAVYQFLSLATAESQGQLGLNISMPPERMELWRIQWQGKI